MGNSVLKLDRMIELGERFSLSAPTPVTENTKAVMRKIITEVFSLSPSSDMDSDRRVIWIHSPVPSFEEFAAEKREGLSASEWKEEGLTDKELKDNYAYEYHGEDEKWYKVLVVYIPADERRDKEFIGIFLNDSYVLQFGDINSKGGFPYDESDSASALLELVKQSVNDVETGTYNSLVADNLPVWNRTGVITRKDYLDVYPENRADFRQGFTDEELDQLDACAKEDAADPDAIPKNAYDNMTARKFFEAVAMGVRSIPYKERGRWNRFTETDEEHDRYGGETPREVYCSMADGRDDGLVNVPLDDAEAFEEWMHGKGPYYVFNGHHPWEIRGSMSLSHSIHLYPVQARESGKWYFDLTGDAYGTSYETVHYFLAMKKAGIPVKLSNIEGINARYQETDYIGILPSYEYSPFSTYVPDVFKDYDVGDCEELPDDPKDGNKLKQLMSKITWLPERKLKLE